VLASCASGVTVAVLVNPSIVEHAKMREVWARAEWCCKTLVFLLGSFVGGDHTYANFSTLNVVLLVVMYFLLMVIRAVMVASLYPALSRLGMGLAPAEAVFVAFVGLRGALGNYLFFQVLFDQR
jgi:NhaP-type Na+/H+ or K+/H+ antiporter